MLEPRLRCGLAKKGKRKFCLRAADKDGSDASFEGQLARDRSDVLRTVVEKKEFTLIYPEPSRRS